MSVARVRALRSLQSSLRHSGTRATPRASAPARTQLAVSRRYASGESGHGHAQPSSDLPWLIGAIVVTIPSAWFVWPDKSHADSAHHGSHDEHAEEHEEKEGGEAPEEEAPQEEAPQEGQEKQDEQAEEVQAEQKEESEPKPESDSTQEEDKSKDSEETGKKASGSGGEGQSTGPDANKLSGKDEKTEEKPTPENYGNTDNGAQFKGKVKDESPGKTEENRKREDDAKGGFKKRIDSGLGKNLGQGPEYDEPEGVSPRTEASATSKQPQKGKQGEISGKQYGLSNTPTRHSEKIEESGEKSTKGEGTPETAKAMGTVSVDRPQK